MNQDQKVEYSQVSSIVEIRQILDLQQLNLPRSLSEEEAKTQGFLTIEHNEEVLLRMNDPHSHIIALHHGRVVGYCLVMTLEHRNEFPVVKDMFVKLEGLLFNGQPLLSRTYFIMGQVCIQKEYRGTGVFEGMYHKLRNVLEPSYQLCVTEVSKINQRSLRAHLKVGFEIVLAYRDNQGHPWELIIWDWTKPLN